MLHRSFSMSQKVGLLENSYRKRALVQAQDHYELIKVY